VKAALCRERYHIISLVDKRRPRGASFELAALGQTTSGHRGQGCMARSRATSLSSLVERLRFSLVITLPILSTLSLPQWRDTLTTGAQKCMGWPMAMDAREWMNSSIVLLQHGLPAERCDRLVDALVAECSRSGVDGYPLHISRDSEWPLYVERVYMCMVNIKCKNRRQPQSVSSSLFVALALVV
jgi:hypothetical protein